MAKFTTVAVMGMALMFAGVAPVAAEPGDNPATHEDTAEGLTGDHTARTAADLAGPTADAEAIRADDTAADPALTDARQQLNRADVDTPSAELLSADDEVVDLSELRRAYTRAMYETQVNYLRHGWPAFENARAAAVHVLALASPTRAEVDTATQNLVDAQAALVYNGAIHDVIQTVSWKDEADYGAATWARFMATVTELEALAVRDLAGDLITESEIFPALNDYYVAEAGLLEVVPLRAAAADFASLDGNHYATIAFAELATIAAGIDRMLADSSDPSKIGAPGDQFLLPRYWAKKDELADIRALTALFKRMDATSHSEYTAHSVAALRAERITAENVVEIHWVTDAAVKGFVRQLEALETALVSVTPLEDSLAAAAALDERHYGADAWSELAAHVAAGKLRLADAADANVPVANVVIASAARAITDAINRLDVTPPLITIGGSPVEDGQSVPAGAALTITAAGLEGGSVLRAELHSTPTLLGSVTADAEGTAVLNVRIPASTPAGEHVLHVFGTAVDGTPLHHAVAVTVVAGPGNTASLAQTGADLTPLHTGGGLLAVGALLLLIRRRYALG